MVYKEVKIKQINADLISIIFIRVQLKQVFYTKRLPDYEDCMMPETLPKPRIFKIRVDDIFKASNVSITQSVMEEGYRSVFTVLFPGFKY